MNAKGDEKCVQNEEHCDSSWPARTQKTRNPRKHQTVVRIDGNYHGLDHADDHRDRKWRRGESCKKSPHDNQRTTTVGVRSAASWQREWKCAGVVSIEPWDASWDASTQSRGAGKHKIEQTSWLKRLNEEPKHSVNRRGLMLVFLGVEPAEKSMEKADEDCSEESINRQG